MPVDKERHASPAGMELDTAGDWTSRQIFDRSRHSRVEVGKCRARKQRPACGGVPQFEDVMLNKEESLAHAGAGYERTLAAEGEYWENFIARRLLEYDEIPGSV